MKWKKKIIHALGKNTGLYLIDDFLSAEECSLLIRMSKTKGMRKGGFLSYDRKPIQGLPSSLLTTYTHNENEIILKINKRIKSFTNFPIDYGEDLKVVCYHQGGYFPPHNDYIPKPNKNIKGGCRVAQMLFYLNDVEEGGETFFPNIGIQVCPVKGRALFWYGIETSEHAFKAPLKLPKIFKSNPYAFHEPLEVKKGEKWIAAKILHNIRFEKENSYYK